jgi:hypothetical protein
MFNFFCIFLYHYHTCPTLPNTWMVLAQIVNYLVIKNVWKLLWPSIQYKHVKRFFNVSTHLAFCVKYIKFHNKFENICSRALRRKKHFHVLKHCFDIMWQMFYECKWMNPSFGDMLRRSHLDFTRPIKF